MEIGLIHGTLAILRQVTSRGYEIAMVQKGNGEVFHLERSLDGEMFKKVVADAADS